MLRPELKFPRNEEASGADFVFWVQELSGRRCKTANWSLKESRSLKLRRLSADVEPLPQPQIAAGRPTAGKVERGGVAAHCTRRPRGPPVDFRSRVAMVEPLAPFQIETISLSL